MNWRSLILIALLLGAMAAAKARADECPGNPNALGTSRVLAISPREFPRIGRVQYTHSLPLEDKEVVLTFDDGPLPPYTNRILEILAEQCVKATYFLVGRMARGYPDLARRILAQGHTIGTHSENHLLEFDHAPLGIVQREIEQGIVSVGLALGNRNAIAPFFRIPGFLRRSEVEAYLQSRHLATWSADIVADDWRHISAAEVVRRAITRLDEKGKGIILLHDIQPATALALPELLRELKAKGYRIVQVVPAKGGTPGPVATKSEPAPSEALPVSASIAQPAEQPAAKAEAAPAAVVLPAIVPKKVALIPLPASDQAGPTEAAVPKPVLPVAAANSLARGEDIPQEPVRPFTSASKPARYMSMPGKFVTTEPGGWPPTVSVPVPAAGGIGVSSRASTSQSSDGRFQ